MKYFFKSALLLGATTATLLPSCKEEKPLNLIGLLDLSSRDSTAISWYTNAIKSELLPYMQVKSRLVILPIDYASLIGSKELFKADFGNVTASEFAGLQESELLAKNLRDSINVAVAQFDTAISTEIKSRLQLPDGTDIFGSLEQAQKYRKAEYRNVVVMFSDMRQFSDKRHMNFEDSLSTQYEVSRFLKIAEPIDLSDIEIIVVTGPQSRLSPEKYKAVKVFWEQYFALCNGRLIDYSSGALSKLEEVLNSQEN